MHVQHVHTFLKLGEFCKYAEHGLRESYAGISIELSESTYNGNFPVYRCILLPGIVYLHSKCLPTKMNMCILHK